MWKTWFFYKMCTDTVFMHLWALMHLIRAHIHDNVKASPFRVPIEPGCSIGPIDVENMVFYKMCTGTVFMHFWAHMHLLRVHVHVNVSASLFRILIEPRCSRGRIDVENMVFFLQNVYPHRFHAFLGPYAFNAGPRTS